MLKRKWNQICKSKSESETKVIQMQNEQQKLETLLDSISDNIQLEKEVIYTLSNKEDFIEQELKFNEIMQSFIPDDDINDIIFHYCIRQRMIITDNTSKMDKNGNHNKISIPAIHIKNESNFIEITCPFYLKDIEFDFIFELYYLFPFAPDRIEGLQNLLRKSGYLYDDDKLIEIRTCGEADTIYERSVQSVIDNHLKKKSNLIIYTHITKKIIYLSYHFNQE